MTGPSKSVRVAEWKAKAHGTFGEVSRALPRYGSVLPIDRRGGYHHGMAENVVTLKVVRSRPRRRLYGQYCAQLGKSLFRLGRTRYSAISLADVAVKVKEIGRLVLRISYQ